MLANYPQEQFEELQATSVGVRNPIVIMDQGLHSFKQWAHLFLFGRPFITSNLRYTGD